MACVPMNQVLAGEIDNSKGGIQGFFPFGKLRVRMKT
jgi:hypothetical protein